MLDKLKIGNEIQIGNIKAKISKHTRFNGIYAVYADIIEQEEGSCCFVYKIKENVALIFRNKEKFSQMGLDAEERKAIYCHELGHCFSEKQKNNKTKSRVVEEEIDSDTFAVEQCNISPIILENALRKTYEYNIKNIKNKKGITQEKLNIFINEMTARKRNVENLIQKQRDMKILPSDTNQVR